MTQALQVSTMSDTELVDLIALVNGELRRRWSDRLLELVRSAVAQELHPDNTDSTVLRVVFGTVECDNGYYLDPDAAWVEFETTGTHEWDISDGARPGIEEALTNVGSTFETMGASAELEIVLTDGRVEFHDNGRPAHLDVLYRSALEPGEDDEDEPPIEIRKDADPTRVRAAARLIWDNSSRMRRVENEIGTHVGARLGAWRVLPEDYAQGLEVVRTDWALVVWDRATKAAAVIPGTLNREPADADLCPWQTAYGLPWTRYCGAPKGEGDRYCPEHTDDALNSHF